MSSLELHRDIVGGHVGEGSCTSTGIAGKDHLWLEADEVDDQKVEEDEVQQPQFPVAARVHTSAAPQSERKEGLEGGGKRRREREVSGRR